MIDVHERLLFGRKEVSVPIADNPILPLAFWLQAMEVGEYFPVPRKWGTKWLRNLLDDDPTLRGDFRFVAMADKRIVERISSPEEELFPALDEAEPGAIGRPD